MVPYVGLQCMIVAFSDHTHFSMLELLQAAKSKYTGGNERCLLETSHEVVFDPA